MNRRSSEVAALLAVATVSSAQSLSPEQMQQQYALLRQHAENYYPALTTAARLPEGVVIGLVVTPDLKVLDHSVLFGQTEGETTIAGMRRMFPHKRISDRSGGGACYGIKTNEPKYCVVWGQLEK